MAEDREQDSVDGVNHLGSANYVIDKFQCDIRLRLVLTRMEAKRTTRKLFVGTILSLAIFAFVESLFGSIPERQLIT